MTGGTSNSDITAEIAAREAVCEVIRETALCLDREDFDGWIELFDADASYEMTAYSSEIRAEMAWWTSSREDLVRLLSEVNQHVRDPARRLHLVSPMAVDVTGDQARALSHFAVYRTEPDGESRLYVVGRYEDELVLRDGNWRYVRHRTVLETRVFDAFTHLPL